MDDKTKYTRGPWDTDRVNSEYMHDIVLGYDVPGEGSPVLLATVHYDEDSILVKPFITAQQATANARLIAAAPDLFEAIQVAINTVECDSIGRDKQELPWYRMAKKAMYKAMGITR